jgi:transposase-like protein
MSDENRYEGDHGRPTVVIEAPRCPHCGSANVVSYRTRRIEVDLLIRKTRCRDCSRRFNVEVR